MDPATIRNGLKTRLSNVTGLRQVHDTAPDSVTPAAVVIAPDPVTFIVRDSQNTWALSFVVTLLVSTAVSRAGQDKLDGFLVSSGAGSVLAAIENEAVPLGGGGDFASIAMVRKYGVISYGNVDYLGCEILVAVGAI